MKTTEVLKQSPVGFQKKRCTFMIDFNKNCHKFPHHLYLAHNDQGFIIMFCDYAVYDIFKSYFIQ